MSRATCDFVDGNVGGSFNHTDAIIARANNRFGDLHVVGVADMDAIGVGAFIGGRDTDVTHPNVLALSDGHMKTLAVGGSDTFDDSI